MAVAPKPVHFKVDKITSQSGNTLAIDDLVNAINTGTITSSGTATLETDAGIVKTEDSTTVTYELGQTTTAAPYAGSSVDTSTLSDGETMIWDSTTGDWVAAPFSITIVP
jgi:hypothetical protein